ncbi:hypothetical protein C8D83_1011107 [Halothiobacillus neapolitanus]|nr:hypothetical protein C8D83_1011107 [Halothiobacillus neapolitanus]
MRLLLAIFLPFIAFFTNAAVLSSRLGGDYV